MHFYTVIFLVRRYRNKDAKDTSLRGNEMNNMETVDRGLAPLLFLLYYVINIIY